VEFYANMVLPDDPTSGMGYFTLTEDVFTYSVTTWFGLNQAQIRGPGADRDAPLIIQLFRTRCIVPAPPDLGGCFYDGSVTLNDNQIDELIRGDWYVWAWSPGNPDNPIVGQIVPEPGVFSILCLSCISAFLMRKATTIFRKSA
jgi:hypothetical protein